MKIAIVGSRNYSQLHLIFDQVARLPAGTIIYTGDARGVDTAAITAAAKHHITCYSLKADWNKHGKAAGMIRNAEIIAQIEECYIYWDGESRGSKNMIDRCKKNGIKHYIIYDKAPAEQPALF